MEEFVPIQEPRRRFSAWKFVKRLFLTIVISIVSIVALAAILVLVYEDEVKAIVIKELNKHLNAEVKIEPQNIDLTILKSFPDCALEFKKLTVMESANVKHKDTLLYTESLTLAFSVKDLFSKHYNIKKIGIGKGSANLKVDKKGNANYIVWKTDTTSKSSDSLAFALEKITLNDFALQYKNSKARVKVEANIARLSFHGEFNNSQYLLKADGSAFVENFQADKTQYLNRKRLRLNVELDVDGDSYTIRKAETDVNEATMLSSGNFVLRDSLISLDILFNGKNLDISSTLSLLPDKFQKQIADYKSDGEFYAKGECHYHYSKPLSLIADFGIRQATITYNPQNTTLSDVNLKGSLQLTNKQSVLKLQDIAARLNANTFRGNVEVSNFGDPYLKLDIAAKTNLAELIAFYPVDTIREISGDIDIDASIEGPVNAMKSGSFNAGIQASGKANLRSLKASFKQSDKDLNIPAGSLVLSGRQLAVSDLRILKGNSDVTLNGEMPDFLGYLFDPAAPLAIHAHVTSESIALEDLIFSAPPSSGSSTSFAIPERLELNVDVAVNKLSFGKFSAGNIKGSLLLKNRKVALKDLSLEAADGQIRLNALADAHEKGLSVKGDCDLERLNIRRLFAELNNFGQTTLEDKHLKGFVTSHVSFAANWNDHLEVDAGSIRASSSIAIEQGELIGFKPLESLAKYIDINELKHIKFSSLQSNIEIDNRMIAIPKTLIKSNAINLELWGKHSFDNVVEYHIKLLISELLAKKPRANKRLDDELSLVEDDPENRRCVFIRMSGPIDNLSIAYDRKGAKEKIREDIRQEKQTIKQILKEEFGFFKKDTVKQKQEEKANQNFQIQFGEEKPKKPNGLQPKKKEDEEDF